MDKKGVVETLQKMSGLVGLVDRETTLIAYYEGAIEPPIMSTEIIWRDISEVKQSINACLVGNIDYQEHVASSFSPKQVVYAGEIQTGFVVWEAANKPLSRWKKELSLFPKEMKEGLLNYYREQVTLELKPAQQAALKGDSHALVGNFFKIVSYWNHLLFTLNDRYLLGQLGAVKQIGSFSLKPVYYLVRVEQAYQYFASHNTKLGFEEYNAIQEEIDHLLKENS